MPNKNSISASYIQKQFWLLDRQGQNSAYHVVSAFQAQHLDRARFISALTAALNRFSALNVKFSIQNGRLLQTRHEGQPFELLQRTETSEEHALVSLGEHAYKAFDLNQGPLIRLVLVQVENTDCTYIAVTIHHVVIDLHSKELLAQAISCEYNGDHGMGSNAMDNFEEYPQFQQQWLVSPSADKARTYWRKIIEDLTRAVVMPEQGRQDEYFEIPISLPEEISVALSRYCDVEQTDAFIVLLASYYYMLAQFSGSLDFAIGVPLSNRKQKSFKDTIGCFVNTLPVRLDINNIKHFSQLRQRARMALLGAHRHQELPLTEIIKLCGEGTDQRQLYNIGFTFEQPMHLDLNGVDIHSMILPARGAQLGCFMRLWYTDQKLCGRLETRGGFWSEQLAHRFVSAFVCFIENLVKSESDVLSDLNYLPVNDIRLLNQFNATEKGQLAGVDWEQHTLLSLFERQVKQSPEKKALVCGGDWLSYKQFDQLSNQFAQQLVQAEVKPGDIVAVFSSRQTEMMVAIYAILKAGAAYLPVDITLPGERIGQMFECAGVNLCVLGPEQRLPSAVAVQTVRCERTAYSNYSEVTPASPAPEDAAYVIFTSGSTGVPKGVVNNHRGIVNRLLWMQDYFALRPGQTVLQKTPYSFDVSVWELFWPLQVGATLVLADHDSHKDPYQMLAQIEEYNVNVIHFVPSMLAAFVDALGNDNKWHVSQHLQSVLCSGEELPITLQNKFKRMLPDVDLFNLYGPTEAAVDVTCWCCDNQDRKQVPIGAPIANTQLYVVDELARQVPIGVVGELWIGGVQVAAGYINSLELTAERFVSNPFASGRVYKTGDYARWTESGVLEYFGRKDFQVKINGLRIELGEIENVLTRQPGISMAAVIVHRIGKGQRLIAYYSLEPGSSVREEGLKAALINCLPAYMVPSQFIRLDAFPLSSSGKVKRTALPPPDDALEQQLLRPTQQPQTATEKSLWQWWSDALGRKKIGVDDTFFDLGGDSMMLMTLYQYVIEHITDSIESVDMFRFTTIRSLAAHLDGEGKGTSEDVGRERAARMQRALRATPRGPRKRMR